MKGLDKDRNRRYETANGFAADVQRYLADEPVLACPPSAGYRLRKFARRNKAAFWSAALILLAIVLGAVVSTWQAVRATVAEGLAGERFESERSARESERLTRDALDAARDEKEGLRTRTNRELSEKLAEAAGLREMARAARPG